MDIVGTSAQLRSCFTALVELNSARQPPTASSNQKPVSDLDGSFSRSTVDFQVERLKGHLLHPWKLLQQVVIGTLSVGCRMACSTVYGLVSFAMIVATRDIAWTECHVTTFASMFW